MKYVHVPYVSPSRRLGMLDDAIMKIFAFTRVLMIPEDANP